MEVVSKNVHWLLPEEPIPCDIFLYFRGQYASAVAAGQTVTCRLLEKLSKAHCSHVYIRRTDEPTWNEWTRTRCPRPTPPAEKEDDDAKNGLYGNKRAELLSYVQKAATKKIHDDRAFDDAQRNALALLQKLAKQPQLDWYFNQFHEPPDLFYHCGRVAYFLAIFLYLRKVALEDEIESICYSALIHELSGDLSANAKTVVSQQTLATLEKKRHPVPHEVIQLLELHDELCSGKGFPNNRKRAEIAVVVRAFTLFNHFDAYRALSSGTRRSRFERTKEAMTARQADYDPALWPLFWDFWEKQLEAVT